MKRTFESFCEICKSLCRIDEINLLEYYIFGKQIYTLVINLNWIVEFKDFCADLVCVIWRSFSSFEIRISEVQIWKCSKNYQTKFRTAFVHFYIKRSFQNLFSKSIRFVRDDTKIDFFERTSLERQNHCKINWFIGMERLFSLQTILYLSNNGRFIVY